jgi:hypothetical protein
MKQPKMKTRSDEDDLPIFVGYQWGEPPAGDDSLIVRKVGNDLEVTAALPDYISEDRPWDFMSEYEKVRKKPSLNKDKLGLDAPHVAFANANSDEELIQFVERFGPIVAKTWKMLPVVAGPGKPKRGDPPMQLPMRARQDLGELRNEQKIFRSALALVAELGKRDSEFNFDEAQRRIAQIAEGIEVWPRQWSRERDQRQKVPLWRINGESIKRVVGLARSERDRILAPQVGARIVLCELINAFPGLVFPNPPEMHSYILYGIRPLLYSILRREFLQPREVAICANTQCRAFFEVQRVGQRFCNPLCSRRQRQREYWRDTGTVRRGERSASITDKGKRHFEAA